MIEFYCDAARPCRPLLIVENGQLLIDKQNLWGKSLKDLFKEGVLELVDVKEIEYTYIAFSPKDVRSRALKINDLKSLKKKLEKARRNNEPIQFNESKTETQKHDEDDLKSLKKILGNSNQYEEYKEEVEDIDEEKKPYTDNEDRELIDTKTYKQYLEYFMKLKSHVNIKNTILALSYLMYNLSITKNITIPEIYSNQKTRKEIFSKDDIISFKYKINLTELENKKDINSGLGLLTNFIFNNRNELNIFYDKIVSLENNFERIEYELKTDLELNILLKRQLHTHSEISPINMFGISGGLIPKANCSPGPRLTYQASMGKQASGQYHLNHHLRFESYKMLNSPTRPFFETETAEPAGLNIMPSGQTLTLAIYSDPMNMEDSFIGCKEYFENHNFENLKYHTHKTSIKKTQNISEEFKKPILLSGEISSRYDAIDEYGIPIIGKYVKENDCIIGKQRKINSIDGIPSKEENASIFLGVREEGFIEKVLITQMADNTIVIKVKIGKLRIQQVGDKMSSRYSQKGTFAEMRAAKDMIRVATGVNKGVVADLMINSASQPSRGTCNNLHEILKGKGFLYDFIRRNATTFESGEDNGTDINSDSNEYNFKLLEENNMDKYGNETMCLPNGKLLKTKVFFGCCSYQSLRHHVDDKIQIRARGEIRPISHQPVTGRARHGGLRLGEMERDAMIASGGSAILNEKLMRVSDKYRTAFCSNCGNYAVSDSLSHKTDKNTCNFCRKSAVFGLLTIPYIYKLIYNMCVGVNINIKHGLEYKIKEQGGSELEKYLS